MDSEITEEVVEDIETTAIYYETYQEEVLEHLTSIEQTQTRTLDCCLTISIVVTVVFVYTFLRNMFSKVR